jgi:replicative DNA helicase
MTDILVVRQQEEALLGAVMRDGRVYEQAREIVTVLDFQSAIYGYAWQACENLHGGGMVIDTITLGDELERMDHMKDFVSGQWSGRALLSRIRENGDPRNFLAYAENVQDYAAKRQILQFMNKGAEWSLNGRRAKDIITDMMVEFSKISLYSAQDEYTAPISIGASEAYDWTADASQGLIVGVPTGFIDLDRILGSLIKSNVYILAGRPKVGKTGFLLSIAHHVAKSGKRVGIFSLEMSRLQVSQRLISMESGVDLHNMILGKLSDNDWPSFTNGVEHVADLPIVINDLSSININQIRQTARKIKAAGGLDLLIVDYIQLASGDGKYERRDLEVSAVSRGLKYLAREFEVPILAAAQLNRAIEKRENKKPLLSDLRESGSLEQDAYAVMFLNKSDDNNNVVELEVAAHRNGPTGICKLTFRAPLAKFENAYAGAWREAER